MNTLIVMPKIGLTMAEGKIVEWKKAVGDKVEKDEVLFVFETEKVSCEVEAQQSGFLIEIVAELEEVVQVGEKVAMMSSEKDANPSAGDAVPSSDHASDETQAVATDTPDATTCPDGGAGRPALASSGKVRATPLARRIARDNGIDLAEIVTAGREGRVRASDVKAAMKQSKAAGSFERKPTPEVLEPALQGAEGKLVKLSGMRRIIADRMLASKVQTAQAYMACSVDASKLLEARASLTPRVEKATEIRPTITDLLLRVTAGAVAAHPVMNTRWTDAGILWLDRLHMGVAMAMDDGLIVPVIRDIAGKSVGEISTSRSDLVRRGRSNALTPDEMQGSTFTLSSLGMFGVEEFNSILNQPESAILSVGAIIDKPVSVDGEVVVRPIMKLTLTYDHRIVDGAKAGAFIKTLKEMLEDPILVIA